MPLSSTRVLLIEDNETLAANVIEILEDEGAQVTHASTGAQAEELAKGGFDIALVDVNLPDATGLDLLQRLKTSGDGLHEILLVTGNATLQDAISAVKGGAYDYILKPFRVSDLLASVDRAWRQVQASRKTKALAEKVAERERNLRTLVDTVQALLLVLDEHGCVVQANPAAAAVTGLTPAELVGMSWINTFVPERERASVSDTLALLRAGESRVTYEHRICGTDGGRERVVSWQSSPLGQPDGSLLIYASGLDVTELKELEQRTRLAERLAAVGTLAAGLAHEIRNPLNSAQLQLHLLSRRVRKSGPDDKLLEPIRMVQSEIERLSHLVHEFLDFARPKQLKVEETDLAELVSHVVELEQPTAHERNITINIAVPERPVRIWADRDKLQQIMLNLLRNAIEALDLRGTIDIAIEHSGGGGLIRVHDNGPGIPPEVLNRLFEPFFSTKAKGTGLGMAICHSLVTQHGGTIRATSDQGATFEVTLPKNPPAARLPERSG